MTIESEYEESRWESIGMLFEGQHPTIRKGFLWGHPLAPTMGVAGALLEFSDHIEWEHRTPLTIEMEDDPSDHTIDTNNTNSISNSSAVCAVVRCIDDHPGVVASGHYVWPSSLLLCDYLIWNRYSKRCCHDFEVLGDRSTHRAPQMDENESKTLAHGVTRDHSWGMPIQSVLELGSGSGILSIVASQIFRDTLDVVVVTDHDPTTLERARENHESTFEVLHGIGAQQTIRTEFLPLEWGSQSEWEQVANCLGSFRLEDSRDDKQRPPTTGSQTCFDLVLGSDLIDRAEVVDPLFCTINSALGRMTDTNNHYGTANGAFLLAQSFAYDAETEAEIDRVCNRFQLVRRVLYDKYMDPNDLGGCNGENPRISPRAYAKIQEFRRIQD